MTTQKNMDDELIRRLKKLQQDTARGDTKAQDAVDNVGTLYGKLKTAFTTAAAIGRGILEYSGPVGAVLGWTAHKLKDAFMWSAYERENGDFKRNADGSLNFSGKRLSKVFAAAMAGVLALNIAGQAAYFHGTQFEELVYTTGKQEIVTGEEYQFTGCTSLPCSTETDNGKFYKVNSSLLFPTLVYPEEDVYANIPQQDAACYVKGYGVYFRSARFLIKSLDLWQNVYSVQCRPYTEAEKAQAIGSGDVTPDHSIEAPARQVPAPAPIPGGL